MYFCCIRKIFKRFCKCIQYLCLDTFANFAKKKVLIFFWNTYQWENEKKGCLKLWPLEKWILDDLGCQLSHWHHIFTSTSKKLFLNVSWKVRVKELKYYYIPMSKSKSFITQTFFCCQIAKKKCWTDHLSHEHFASKYSYEYCWNRKYDYINAI